MGAVAGYEAATFMGSELGFDIGGPPGAAIGGILGVIAGVLEDIFGGGGPSYPAWEEREATHPGGLVPLVAPIEGLPSHYPPNQEKSMLLPVVPLPSGGSSFGPETAPFGGRLILVGDPLGQPTPTPSPSPTPNACQNAKASCGLAQGVAGIPFHLICAAGVYACSKVPTFYTCGMAIGGCGIAGILDYQCYQEIKRACR